VLYKWSSDANWQTILAAGKIRGQFLRIFQKMAESNRTVTKCILIFKNILFNPLMNSTFCQNFVAEVCYKNIWLAAN
jgi:hypothetical protein